MMSSHSRLKLISRLSTSSDDEDLTVPACQYGDDDTTNEISLIAITKKERLLDSSQDE